jgi:acetolactate synthase small subunit
MTFRSTKQVSALSLERVSFVIKAENRADVLARVVLLFHRLNVEIDALYMVRRRRSETMRMSVTIQFSREGSRRIEANLYKIASVASVEIGRGAKEVLGEPFDDEPRTQSRR